MIKASDIANLREITGLGMMECKKALEEANGDQNKALDFLKKRGATKAASKSDRSVKAGVIEAYVHDSKIGVLVEVLAETDFVTRNQDFKDFVHDIALHIAASSPIYVSTEDVPSEEVEKEKSALLEQDDLKGKSKEIAEKIVEGRIKKYYGEICLMEQSFIKDPDKKISDLLNAIIAKIGEKIVISRFIRYQIGL
jgi:elongation factor Ts